MKRTSNGWKLSLTEQQAAMWVGAGTVTLLVPCILANLGTAAAHSRAVPSTPPALVAEAGHPVPSDAPLRDASDKAHARLAAEVQTTKTAFTVLDGIPTAAGIVATEYILRTGAGSYVSTLPVFLVGARAGDGTAHPPDAPPEGKTVLWAGQAYLAGTSRQPGPDGAVQTIYQYAATPEQALALLSQRDGRAMPDDDAPVVASR